jgi:hypothetical protein
MTLIVGSVIGVGMGRPGNRRRHGPTSARPAAVTPARGRAAIGSLADIAGIVAGETGTSAVTAAGPAR